MKKAVSLLFITSLLLVVNVFGQGKPKESFSISLSAGAPFSSVGKNLADDYAPTLSVDFSFRPAVKFLFLKLGLWGLVPYSPGLLDSSQTIIPIDSLHPNGGVDKSYNYNKSSRILISAGILAGGKNGKGFVGGVNTGFGISFSERNNKLMSFAAWDLAIEGGYQISKSFSILGSFTSSYTWMSKGSKDSQINILALKVEIRF